MADRAALDASIRVRVFVDFWNFTLSMKDVDPALKVNWKALGPCLTKHAAALISDEVPGAYQGMNVYGSYDANNAKDVALRRWFSNVLDTFPGVHTIVVARQRKKTGPKCPACYTVVDNCPSCGADMRGTEEKGVDTRLAADMISLAWEDNYDVAVLVSSDRDFVPVAEFLDTKGKKVIHGAFPKMGFHLTQKCWGSIKISDLTDEIKR